MDVKRRSIRLGTEVDCFLIDEYGIDNRAIYHRYVEISRKVFEVFQEDPDEQIRMDAFLQKHGIDPEWKQIAEDEIDNHPKLLEDIDMENMPDHAAGTSEETENKMYGMAYDALSAKDTLINDPLILDVFNEAIRDDSDLSDWESVFPFFR